MPSLPPVTAPLNWPISWGTTEMPMSHTSGAGLFLLQALFGIVILILLLRFLFQLMRVDFYNPISQTVSRISDPVLRPIRPLLPSSRRIDSASLVLLLLLQFLHLLLIASLQGIQANLLGLAILSVTELLSLTAGIFFWSIIILAVLSWFQPHAHHPGVSMLQQLSDPLLGPIRRRIPPTAGVDFTPIIALLGIKVAEFLLVAPLQDIAGMLLR